MEEYYDRLGGMDKAVLSLGIVVALVAWLLGSPVCCGSAIALVGLGAFLWITKPPKPSWR